MHQLEEDRVACNWAMRGATCAARSAADSRDPREGGHVLTRYLVGSIGAYVGGVIVITMLLILLGHIWFVSVGLALIWSLCLQLIAWGSAYVLWPDATRRIQARMRSSYPPSVADFGRRLDRSVGLEIEDSKSSVARLRALGGLGIAVMLVVGLAGSWVILAAIGK